MKKIISVALSFIIMVVTVFGIMSPERVEAASYNANAALDYARAHWNDGQGLCAEFVSRCAQAGGINMPVIKTTYECYKKISEISGIPGQDLVLNASGYATYAANSSRLAAGDVVVQWCYTCNLRPHILLCGGYNASGNATFYAHNSALNNGLYRLNKNSQHKSTCNIGAKVIHLAAPADTTAPVISDVHVTDVNSDGYTVVCRAEDAGGISKVQFPTWTHANGQDDLHPDWMNDAGCRGWQNGTTWSFRVNINEHNNEEGWYCTHIYAWDMAGNSSNAGIDAYVDRTAPVISDVQVSEVSAEGYTVTCKVEDDVSGISRVQFPTWTVENDQDDIVENWGENPICSGTQNGTIWTYRVKASDHNNEKGFYRTHIYAWDAAGNRSAEAVPDVLVEEPKRDPETPDPGKLSVGELHIEDDNGAAHYYCDVLAVPDVAAVHVNITTDTGISRDYMRPVKNGKVDEYIYWMDFSQGMDAVYTITVTASDASGNTASSSGSIDAKPEILVAPSEAVLYVGESIQLEAVKKGVLRIDSEKWNIIWTDVDKGVITISDEGLVTALRPGECTAALSYGFSQWSVEPEDWEEDKLFFLNGLASVGERYARITVKLPPPGIQNIAVDKNGTVNLSIRESTGADNYEISMKQIGNGAEGNELLRKLKAGETAQTFSGLKDGSVWSYKVRAYCTVGEEIYYSDWSAEATVKVGADEEPSYNTDSKNPVNQNPGVGAYEESSYNTDNKNPVTKNPGSSSGTGNRAEDGIPKKTSISGKLTAKSKGFTVKWKKQKSVTGYQIQYSTNKKFTKKTSRIKVLKKASTTKLTVKKLKANKKYYVRVRTYLVVNGKKYYSSWSKVKTVRTKR